MQTRRAASCAALTAAMLVGSAAGRVAAAPDHADAVPLAGASAGAPAPRPARAAINRPAPGQPDGQPARTAPDPVTMRTLANGLKVFVREDHRAPTAIQMIWYRVGALDEVSGRTGVAHVLEHMMFKGTEAYPDGEFSRRVAARGGRENAFTTRDYTGYYQRVPPEALDEMMALEADRMRNLRLQQASFTREVAVVMEERRQRIEDNPFGRVGEQLMAQAFLASPVRTPVIGWMDDLQNLTPQDVRDWYDTWYAPNNAVLVVGGDVDTDAVMAMAERHFGGVARRALPVRRPQREPGQQGMRRAVVKAPADSPYVVLGFKVPRMTDMEDMDEPVALEMLAAVLDAGDTARLTRELVRGRQLANSASAGYSLLGRGPNLFTLAGTPVRGRTVAELESALREQVDRIAREGVSEPELQRIKAQYVADRIFGRDSLYGQLMEIGNLDMAGLDCRDYDRLLDRVQAVTAGQVQAVAGKYFGDDQLTVVELDPQPLAGEPAPSGQVR